MKTHRKITRDLTALNGWGKKPYQRPRYRYTGNRVRGFFGVGGIDDTVFGFHRTHGSIKRGTGYKTVDELLKLKRKD